MTVELNTRSASVKTAYEANANTNAFTDVEKTKLTDIEALADVTDTTNVTAAGALMDSEVANLAQVKAFSSADYATAAQGATAGTALQNVVEDTTPQLGGALDGQGHDLNNLGVAFLTEQAAAEADVAGKGQFWVQTATPNIPMFTDDAGTDFNLQKPTECLIIAVSDEATALTTGVKVTFYMPYAMTLTGIKASCLTAPTAANLITDVHLAGTSIMTTDKLVIEATEFHTKDATTPPALTTTALTNDGKIEIEIDQVGSTIAGAGLKVYLIGTRT